VTFSNQALRELEELRQDKLEKFNSDPFIGYKTIEEALDDYKCSTQAEVLARMLKRENVFISGPAGSGKTTIINRFIDIIDAEYSGEFEIAVTASTGIAATLINGQTIHSWAGLGIDTEPFDKKNISGMMWTKADQLRYTDALIIDEISMLPAYLFEKLDAVLKYFRRSSEPFGGIQLILTGDFLQLPPVDKGEEEVNSDYAITTEAWQNADIHYCYMDKSHRATDKRLKYVLGKIASGKVDDKVRNFVESRSSDRVSPDKNKSYTTLYTTNKNVDKFNQEELAKNTNRPVTLKASTSGDPKFVEKIFKNQGVLKEITLKVGAIVMLTANIRDPETQNFYANGSIGRVESIMNKTPRVRFNDGRTLSIDPKIYEFTKKKTVKDFSTGKEIQIDEQVASVFQVPLKLGYAITVHKSQGQTFDGVIVDLSKCFVPGLGYVALSRVRDLDDLVITGLNSKALQIDPRSRKISNFVKKNALKSREEFIEKKDEYLPLLETSIARSIYWRVDESGGYKLRQKRH
jgi:ATP-dependent exoDNAse (exonuclease V) alpha subunit